MKTIKQESVALLKRKIKNLESEKKSVEGDRDLYRNYVVKRFKDNLALVGTKETISPESVVKNIADLFAKGHTFKIWW